MAKRIGINIPEIPLAQIMRWIGHKNLVTTDRYTLHQLQALMGHKDPKTTQRLPHSRWTIAANLSSE